MINRILIRTKVVQLLYSTLLTENKFKIESAPLVNTKEGKFTFEIYMDTLKLFINISDALNKNKKNLKDSRFIFALKQDSALSDYFHNTKTDKSFESLVSSLSEIIKDSRIYKDFIKEKNPELNNSLWESLFNLIIFPDPSYRNALKNKDNYSLGGVEKMRVMINDTFKNFYATYSNINDGLRILEKSMQKARDLYMMLLLLPVDITFLRKQEIDENRHKFIKTEDDINPDTKFIDNRMVRILENNEDLKNYSEKNGTWLSNDHDLVKSLLKAVKESAVYKEYMSQEVTDLKEDSELWKELLKKVILNNENFLEYLENKSIFWNDDLETMVTFAIKSFSKCNDETQESPVFPMYKDKEDENFGFDLYKDVLRNKEKYNSFINENLESDKWESGRLAFMDVVILLTAIAEIINYPKIPIAVSVNEYVEIAKSYSTNKSGTFVHGFLAAIIENLKKNGIINK